MQSFSQAQPYPCTPNGLLQWMNRGCVFRSRLIASHTTGSPTIVAEPMKDQAMNAEEARSAHHRIVRNALSNRILRKRRKGCLHETSYSPDPTRPTLFIEDDSRQTNERKTRPPFIPTDLSCLNYAEIKERHHVQATGNNRPTRRLLRPGIYHVVG